MTVTSLGHEGPPPHPKPEPLQSSLVASAARLTKKTISRAGGTTTAAREGWQEDAWDMYDLVGEQRFLATTLANRMSQARLFVGKLPDDPTEDLDLVEQGPAYDVFQTLVGKGHNTPQMIQRMGLNLFVSGDGYLFGEPEEIPTKDPKDPMDSYLQVDEEPQDVDPLSGIDLDSLHWRMLSVSECSIDGKSGKITVKGTSGEDISFDPDEVVLIRVWRSHPRRWWQADSPTRSSLPVLRELVGLTMHISAQVDSRLAGAGIFLVPASADAAMRAMQGTGNQDESPFSEALMDTMSTAIEDRASAAALVPVTSVVPDESIEKFRFISFANQLDGEARELRDEAIRRLALGQDCPPELLLGVAGMNHWGAWLVREDVVTTHLEPPLAIICDALTTQYLWPVLELNGVEDFHKYVVWYDVDHLVMRPNRSQDAKDAKNMGLIKDSTARDAMGFDESDAPAHLDPAITIAMTMIQNAPSLAQNPGLGPLIEDLREALKGQTPEEPSDVTEAETPTEGGVPATADDQIQEPTE